MFTLNLNCLLQIILWYLFSSQEQPRNLKNALRFLSWRVGMQTPVTKTGCRERKSWRSWSALSTGKPDVFLLDWSLVTNGIVHDDMKQVSSFGCFRCLIRRTSDILSKYLPVKIEQVVCCRYILHEICIDTLLTYVLQLWACSLSGSLFSLCCMESLYIWWPSLFGYFLQAYPTPNRVV